MVAEDPMQLKANHNDIKGFIHEKSPWEQPWACLLN